MNMKNILRLFVASAIVIVLFFVAGLANRPGEPTNGNNVFKLQPPPFVSVARAETGAAPLGIIENEAGIAAYFKAPSSINPSDAAPVFRTIEVSTTNYIIGSVPVLNYPESQDVHVYIQKDGWVLAYYLAADPTAKISDWYGYTGGTTISTKLEKVLVTVAGQIGSPSPAITFYHFQFPNATNMMLIAEKNDGGGNTFTTKVPSSYVFYERSWSSWVGCCAQFNLDGTNLSGVNAGGDLYYGIITPSQFLPETTHTIRVDNIGGLALIYRVQ